MVDSKYQNEYETTCHRFQTVHEIGEKQFYGLCGVTKR